MEREAQKWQWWYNRLQITLVLFSTLTATMAGIDGIPRLVVAGAGFIAAASGGLLAAFKIQERIYAIRKAEAEVRLECQKYDYRIDDYEKKSEEERYIILSKKITSIQGQEMLQEVERWNPKKEEKKEEEKTAQDKIQKDEEASEASERKILAEQPDQISEGKTQVENFSEIAETPQDEKSTDSEK